MFSENLLRARGQIAWILALTLSTAIIIHLESMDTEVRIQDGIKTSIAAAKGLDGPTLDLVASALKEARAAYGAQPTDPAAQTAMIVAVASAVQAGVLDRTEGQVLSAQVVASARAATPQMDAAKALARITFHDN